MIKWGDYSLLDSTVQINVNNKLDKSFADDLNSKRGAVRSRVVLLLRSTEAKPLFSRFVYSLLLNQLFYFQQKIKKLHSSQIQQALCLHSMMFTFIIFPS